MGLSKNEKFDNELQDENLGTLSVERSQQKQTEILKRQTTIIENQTNFTKILTLATAILAIATVYQFLFHIPSTILLTYGKIPDPKSMLIFLIGGILLFLFLAVALYFILSYKKK